MRPRLIRVIRIRVTDGIASDRIIVELIQRLTLWTSNPHQGLVSERYEMGSPRFELGATAPKAASLPG